MDELKQKLSERAAKARQKASQARKELDRRILDLTSSRFEKVRKILSEKKEKWEKEGDVAYRLAETVLNKARSIRESLSGIKSADGSSGSEEVSQAGVKRKTGVRSNAKSPASSKKLKKKSKS